MLSEVVEWEVRLRPRKEGSMSILIKGMEMPTEPMVLILFPDGNISTEEYEIGANAKAIELPPHGRLIDADAFDYTCKFNYCNGCEDWNGLKCKTCWVDDMLGELEDAPTIIESEE